MNYVKSLLGYSSRSNSPSPSSSDLNFDSLQPTNSDRDETKTVENEADKKSLWHMIKGLIGVDISTTVSLPIWMFEDTSYLQRLCEMTEFSPMIDKASTNDNQFERLLHVAVYCIAGFHGTERFDKPFNPVIGETFEYVRPENNCRFIAEQVIHKPPISVGYLENENFRSWVQGTLNVRFMGNSIDVDPKGSKGFLEIPKYGDFFTWTHPRATVSNCLVGTVWVDHYGDMPIHNHTTKDKIVVKWKKCGWFAANRYDIEGDIVDKNGVAKISISGKWSKAIYAKWLFEGGSHPKGETVCMWTNDPTQVGVHKKTPYCMRLNEMDAEYQKLLPPTDARLRPDRLALEKAEKEKAGIYKLRVEEKQRTQENARKERGDVWNPCWFKSSPDEYFEGETVYKYAGGYWEQREKKKALLETEPEAAEKLLVREDYKDKACDFRSYAVIETPSTATNAHKQTENAK